MNNKTQKFREELEKVNEKIAALKERGKALEQKIRDAEVTEIYALLNSGGLSKEDLIALARAKKEGQTLPYLMGRQAEGSDAEADDDQDAAMKQDTDTMRRAYIDDDEEDEDDE